MLIYYLKNKNFVAWYRNLDLVVGLNLRVGIKDFEYLREWLLGILMYTGFCDVESRITRF